MKKIYIDIDDVIANTTKTIPDLANRMFGKKIRYEDLTSFNLNESLKLTPEQMKVFFATLHQEDILMTFTAVDGSVDAIERLIKMGYEIYLITGRPPQSYEVTRKWLSRQGFSYDYLYFADKYDRYQDQADKPFILSMTRLAEYTFELVVEDSMKMARWFRDRGTRVAIMDHPWNRELAEDSKVTRCQDWDSVMSLLD